MPKHPNGSLHPHLEDLEQVNRAPTNPGDTNHLHLNHRAVRPSVNPLPVDAAVARSLIGATPRPFHNSRP
jgi:hypothetical protein